MTDGEGGKGNGGGRAGEQGVMDGGSAYLGRGSSDESGHRCR